MNNLCQIEPEIFLVFTFTHGKVHYGTDSSSPTLDETFRGRKKVKLMQTAHLRNLIKTPVVKDLWVFNWRLNERFVPYRTGDMIVFNNFCDAFILYLP